MLHAVGLCVSGGREIPSLMPSMIGMRGIIPLHCVHHCHITWVGAFIYQKTDTSLTSSTCKGEMYVVLKFVPD